MSRLECDQKEEKEDQAEQFLTAHDRRKIREERNFKKHKGIRKKDGRMR